MRKQAGLSLINMVLWAILLGLTLILGLKLVPVYSEYFGIKSAFKAIVKEKAGAPIADIRESFAKRAEIENIKSLKPDELDIIQDQSGTSIGATYEAIVPLVANVSLVFNFELEEKQAGAAAE